MTTRKTKHDDDTKPDAPVSRAAHDSEELIAARARIVELEQLLAERDRAIAALQRR